MFDPHNIDDWGDYPSYLASVQERARNAPAERARRQVSALSKPDRFEPLPVQPLHPMADIGPLFTKPTPRWKNARSKNVDMLLEQLGVGRR